MGFIHLYGRRGEPETWSDRGVGCPDGTLAASLSADIDAAFGELTVRRMAARSVSSLRVWRKRIHEYGGPESAGAFSHPEFLLLEVRDE